MKTDKKLKTKIQDIVNPFIAKWCTGNYMHLTDDDENDGERLRQDIEKLVINYPKPKNKQIDFSNINIAIYDLKNSLDKNNFGYAKEKAITLEIHINNLMNYLNK